jgi:hypothetical protein
VRDVALREDVANLLRDAGGFDAFVGDEQHAARFQDADLGGELRESAGADEHARREAHGGDGDVGGGHLRRLCYRAKTEAIKAEGKQEHVRRRIATRPSPPRFAARL